MSGEERCPLCQLRERAKGLVSEPEAAALKSCAAVAPTLAMLPARLGFRLLAAHSTVLRAALSEIERAAGAFLFAGELCKAKSFVASESVPAGGPAGARKEG